MVINEKERNKILMNGAVAGLATPFLLKYAVMPVLNFIGGFAPQLSMKLASTANPVVSINVRESLTGVNGALSGWLVDALGLTIKVPGMTYILAAIGGALLFLLGAYAADQIGMLKGNAIQKTRTTIFIGSAAAAFILGGFAVPQIGITLVNTLIAFGINAAILAWAYGLISEQLKVDILPF